MNEFQSLQKNVVSTSGTKSQMTLVYLKDISLLLSLVFAAREQNLDLHLPAEREILKLLHAHDHVHYSRCNTFQHVFLCDEKRTNSDIYKDLVEHGYIASITGDTFSAVHGDLITEWFNKQTKGKGGLFRSGYSTKLSAVNTYVRTMHIHAQLHLEMKIKLMINTSSSHKDLSPRAMKRHKTHVNDLNRTMTKLYGIDRFSDGPAMSISSGTEIDPGIISGLLGTKDMGNKCYLDFVTQRLVDGTVQFFDRIPANKLKTGVETKKKKKKAVALLSEDRQAFGVLAANAISLNDAFNHPITTIPEVLQHLTLSFIKVIRLAFTMQSLSAPVQQCILLHCMHVG